MTIVHRLIAATCLAAALSPSLAAIGSQHGSVLDRLPAAPDAAARYVIYLHGRIIEDKGRRPTDAQWGTYEYDAILETLARGGATVVSEQRRPSTDVDAFAAHVADQVRALLGAGVPPDHVSVVGFSKGGAIAIRTSVLVGDPRVNFVFLAACGNGDFSAFDGRAWGRILSIYEASDDIGHSCRDLFERSSGTGERAEIEIHVGEEHGTFYRPHEEWVAPVLRWVAPTR